MERPVMLLQPESLGIDRREDAPPNRRGGRNKRDITTILPPGQAFSGFGIPGAPLARMDRTDEWIAPNVSYFYPLVIPQFIRSLSGV
jgi:hypothetical protein